MAGEIGIVKHDIAYSGDVLNTTSRIQSKCNELNVNILIPNIFLICSDLYRILLKPEKWVGFYCEEKSRLLNYIRYEPTMQEMAGMITSIA